MLYLCTRKALLHPTQSFNQLSTLKSTTTYEQSLQSNQTHGDVRQKEPQDRLQRAARQLRTPDHRRRGQTDCRRIECHPGRREERARPLCLLREGKPEEGLQHPAAGLRQPLHPLHDLGHGEERGGGHRQTHPGTGAHVQPLVQAGEQEARLRPAARPHHTREIQWPRNGRQYRTRGSCRPVGRRQR